MLAMDIVVAILYAFVSYSSICYVSSMRIFYILQKTGYASIVPNIDKADTWGTIRQWTDINAVARSIQDKCGSLDAPGYISKKLLST